MKRVAILGSTGSVGTQTLEVIRQHGDRFEVVSLSAHRNIDLLQKQIQEFRPSLVCITDEAAAEDFGRKSEWPIYIGQQGLLELIADERVDMVVNALVGTVGIVPTLVAIEQKKDVALANKETMVAAGDIVMSAAKMHGVRILPVDSEPSAIWQCLEGQPRTSVHRIILTASGGPFRLTPLDALPYMSPHAALQHPTWHMGQKISIDSATMMNKGFEVIEAMHLFGLSLGQIHIVIHPESIVHSMVEFCDGSILAQLSAPDMRIPIQHALCYPERIPSGNASCTFESFQSLTFEQLSPERYPCVSLAYEAIRKGGTMPAVLNAANDVLVSRFLSGDIYFGEIAKGIAYVMVNYEPIANPGLNDILNAISWAQEFVQTY